MRLKGRVTADALPETIDEEAHAVTQEVERLAQAGQLAGEKLLKVTDDGRARLRELLAGEREGIDNAALAAAYDDFRKVNNTFKALVSDWQLKDGQPNTHDDAEYDASILGRLPEVHTQALTVLDRVIEEVPRLSVYRAKLDKASSRSTRKHRLADTADRGFVSHCVV